MKSDSASIPRLPPAGTGDAGDSATGLLSDAALWARFRASRSIGCRNELVRRYTPHARHIALHLSGRFPPEVDQDDVVSAGVIGLMDAIERFDPDLGVSFITFAFPRIRGAIFDEVRNMDWAPRRVRERQRRVAAARDAFCGQFDREPTKRELAECLEVSPAELEKILADAVEVKFVSLSRDRERSGKKTLSLGASLRDRRLRPPAEELADRDQVEAALRPLPRRLGLVLRLYYGHCLTMSEIGQSLGYSEAMISYLRRDAMAQLAG